MGEHHEGQVPAAHRFVKKAKRTLAPRRRVVQAGTDALAWVLGLTLAIYLRFEFSFDSNEWGPFGFRSLLQAALAVAVLQIVIGASLGLYTGRWRYGSFDELSHLGLTVLLTAAGTAVLNVVLARRLVPMSVVLIGMVFAIVLMCASRYAWRVVIEYSLRPSAEVAQRVVVFGAGEGGSQALRTMLRNPKSPYLPVALFDDDPSLRNLRLSGVPVIGDRTDIAREAHRLGATTLVVAIPSADAGLLRELSDLALDADLEVRVLPSLAELLDSTVGVGDIRPLNEVDLLGRHHIDTDIDSIADYLSDRRVLVTGAGGSIGSELCRQIARYAPAQLVMLDRDESALHALQLSLEGRAMLDSRNLVVGDIRDGQRMHEVFAQHQPQVVFHAAALKHLPLLELYPAEALKTNVIGTQNVLDAGHSVGVDRFVNISTDKAADPCSVLGYTKRIAEMLTAQMACDADKTYLSVRFGNVLGSRGSVLTAFRSQIASGGPVTVTDPEVTRYFMTTEEAVQLVIQAGAIGNAGEALVLDMGEPVRIDDVARRLAAEADRPIDVVYTGLRRGEKLHEVLLGTGEVDDRPRHHLVSQVGVPPLEFHRVVTEAAGLDESELIGQLQRMSAHVVDLADPSTRPGL